MQDQINMNLVKEGLGTGNMLSFLESDVLKGDPTKLMDYISSLHYGEQMLQELQTTGTVTTDTINKLNNEMYIKGVKSANKFGDQTEEVAGYMDDLNSSASKANSTLKTFR